MTLPHPITIVLADDHPIVLRGLRAVLEAEPSLRVLAELHDGATAWQSIQKLNPAVAILDLEMQELDGLQVARRVLRHQMPVKVIILTMHRNEELFRQALDLGCLGYVLKEELIDNIVRCVKTVMAGRHFISPALSSFLVASGCDPEAKGNRALRDLSVTQREVLKLVGRGLTSKEIGHELGVSYRTVENHRFRIAEKLGLKGSNSLLRFAMENKADL